MNPSKSTTEKLFTSPISILVMSVFIVVVNLLWFLPTVSSLRSSISNIERSTVRTAITQVDGFLESRKLEVEVPAGYINQDLESKGNDLILKKILRGEYIAAVYLSDKNGNEVIKYDKSKTILAKDMQSIFDRKDFRQTIETKEVSWSDVAFSNKAEPTITVNIPVFSPARDVVGVLSGEFKINSIFNTISSIGIGEEVQAYIVDRNGILVSGGDLSFVLKNTDYSGRKIVKDTLMAQNEIVTANNDEYSYENEKGVKVLVAGGRVSKTGWAVIFEEPRSEAIANIIKLTISALASVVLFVFMAIFIRAIYLKVVFAGKELEKSLLEQKELFEEANRLKKDSEEANKHLQEKDRNLAEKVIELEDFQKFFVDRELKMVELKKELAELKSKLPQP